MPALDRRIFLLSGAAAATAMLGRSLPALGAEARLTFLVLGDWGFKASPSQRNVANAMARVAADIGPRFVISVGDNFYGSGVKSTHDPQWEASFKSVYSDPALRCPWYPVLGNHDYRGNVDAEVAYSHVDPRWAMPARYYIETMPMPGGATADFFFIDTTPIVDPRLPREPVEAQLLWLENGLKASQAEWKIVVGHHPVYSGGEHGSSATLIERLKPLIDRHGVRAYLNGHDHDLQHIAVDGVHYLTCGSGAEARPSGRLPTTFFSGATLGFIAAMLTPDRLTVFFINAEGEAIYKAAIPVVA